MSTLDLKSGIFYFFKIHFHAQVPNTEECTRWLVEWWVGGLRVVGCLYFVYRERWRVGSLHVGSSKETVDGSGG